MTLAVEPLVRHQFVAVVLSSNSALSAGAGRPGSVDDVDVRGVSPAHDDIASPCD